MRILSIMWSSYLPLLNEAAQALGVDLSAYSTKQIKREPGLVSRIAVEIEHADLVLLYRTSDEFWEELEQTVLTVKDRMPVVVVGPEPSFSALSNVNPEIVATVYTYILFGGAGNMRNMLGYLLSLLFGEEAVFEAPEPLPWEGIHHPAIPGVFPTTADFLSAYQGFLPSAPASFVGLLFSRSNWVTRNLEVEAALISALEARGLGVIPVFYYSLKDDHLGNMSGVEVVEHFLMEGEAPRVDAVVKLSAFFLGSERGGIKKSDAPSGVELLKRLGVPVFAPVISYYKDRKQWLDDPEGLGSQVAWSVAMPEFEGVIEPLVIGASRSIAGPEEESYEALTDRIEKLADRIARWIGLRNKPNRDKRVAFILNNNPCAGVEATVGGGAHLDTLESVVDIMKRMQKEGYLLDPPESGKALIDEIMARKAISEFRWTTVDEIVAKGGALALVENDRYLEWFNELPEPTRTRMAEAWGNPPGEEKDGIPAAMVYEGNILVTGLRFGNAVVCVQPKRGCAGARCDGRVCKILHDPSVPPPHQYIATYKWLSREFGADVVVHVGTHGNLEFLPGKATGLSSGCLPDAAIDTMPNLYIYNADNPPEGTIAKRRASAVLVDHMQAVMVQGELYGDLDELERLLAEYTRYRQVEPAKAHTISHMIMDRVKALNFLDGDRLSHDMMDEAIAGIHEKLSLLKNTYIPKGMHIFGRIPQGADLANLIYAILRYESGPGSLRAVVSGVIGRTRPGQNGDTAETVEAVARGLCRGYVEHGTSLADGMTAEFTLLSEERDALARVEEALRRANRSIVASDEMASLLAGFTASYIEPGPSGLITRGRPDILPTGRNFYSLDPQTIPTRGAWEIGKSLADKTLYRYLLDEGDYPENIAFYWQCTDIMWADGEGMAQMMYLLGVKPIWRENGRVKAFDVIPLPELGRPRIDLTVRVSGITRDNFSGAIDLLDEAVRAVAALPEPVERNFVRKHTLERLGGRPEEDEAALRQATYRVFASMPGTYQAGTQLAVYASAWKTQEDLADVFLYWNGYAYGKGVFGEPAHKSLKENLASVKCSFNKTVTDEYDLTGCCCYFGAHGGMINAARVVSGREIKNYYGDTRSQNEVTIRTLTEEVRRVARAKLLNPKWIEGMKEHGYKGAAEISKRVGRLYGWQATARTVDQSIFDDVTRTFLMDAENRRFFQEQNPWAMEEMGRRLIEAMERGLWSPSPDVREALTRLYLEVEGWIEERMDGMEGEFQGGAIDVMTSQDVEGWKKRMEEVLG
jgi:cobaltochelatase CobN